MLKIPLTRSTRCLTTAIPSSSTNKALFWTAAVTIPVGFGIYFYSTGSTVDSPAVKKSALDPKAFKPFKLKEIIAETPNTKTFRFELPEGTNELGLPTTSCVVTRLANGKKDDGTENVVIRPYTPIEWPDHPNTFDLVVKQYPTGLMSSHIFSLKPGDTLDIKGPIEKLPYSKGSADHIVMVAGGSGLTPMLQLIQRIEADKSDKTSLTLLFANVTQEDIILKKQLDDLAKASDRFNVYYVLDKPPKGWTGGSGFVSEQHIGKCLNELRKKTANAGDKAKVLVCGPPKMLEMVAGPKGPKFTQGEVGGILKKMGFTEENVYKF